MFNDICKKMALSFTLAMTGVFAGSAAASNLTAPPMPFFPSDELVTKGEFNQLVTDVYNYLQLELRPAMIAAQERADQLVPSGMVFMFTNQCPNGWEVNHTLNERLARGTDTMGEIGSQGGNTSHSHGLAAEKYKHNYARSWSHLFLTSPTTGSTDSRPPYTKVMYCTKL